MCKLEGLTAGCLVYNKLQTKYTICSSGKPDIVLFTIIQDYQVLTFSCSPVDIVSFGPKSCPLMHKMIDYLKEKGVTDFIVPAEQVIGTKGWLIQPNNVVCYIINLQYFAIKN